MRFVPRSRRTAVRSTPPLTLWHLSVDVRRSLADVLSISHRLIRHFSECFFLVRIMPMLTSSW